jgi:hypothetical protein
MTVIRILLIIGLVYIALQQKKESTRNVILVITGLLAFCMMGKEGLQVISPITIPRVWESCTGTSAEISAGTCTGTATATADATCEAGPSVSQTDGLPCRRVTDLSTEGPCRALQRAGGSGPGNVGIPAPACTYTPASAPTCDLDSGTDATDACPAGCLYMEGVALTCDLDSATDGTAVCPTDCSYVAPISPITAGETRDFSAGDLIQFIPSCTRGKVVNAYGTACTDTPDGAWTQLPSSCTQGKVVNGDGTACTDPTHTPASYSTLCGQGVCTYFGGDDVSDNEDNLCNENIIGQQSTCTCEEDKTWMAGVNGDPPTCV